MVAAVYMILTIILHANAHACITGLFVKHVEILKKEDSFHEVFFSFLFMIFNIIKITIHVTQIRVKILHIVLIVKLHAPFLVCV
jgi:hypothetical protein